MRCEAAGDTGAFNAEVLVSSIGPMVAVAVEIEAAALASMVNEAVKFDARFAIVGVDGVAVDAIGARSRPLLGDVRKRSKSGSLRYLYISGRGLQYHFWTMQFCASHLGASADSSGGVKCHDSYQ